jgi:drug/metabolite transporter (DMT)-like permease
MHLSTPFSSSLVLTSGPIFTLAILAFVGAERLRLRQVAGTVVALAGIVVFLSDKFAAGLSRAGLGDLMLIAAAALFSLYTVLVQPLARRYGPLIVLCYTLLFSAPPILVWTLPGFLATPASAYSVSVWIGLGWALVVSSFFGWLLWTWVNAVRGVARSAPLNYLMPPIAGLVAWLTLGEAFTWLKIGGALLTMAGVAYAQFGGGPPPKEAAQADTV